MKLLYILPLIFATTAAFKIEGRIRRGNKASWGEFPYQVGLRLVDNVGVKTWCGGSLIDTEWVLTAAHCLMGIDVAVVFVGTTVRAQAECKRFALKDSFIIHGEADIALIKIRPVILDAKIQTIKLPSIFKKVHPDYYNTFAIASGWGRISNSGPLSKDLLWARLEIISNTVCKKLYFAFPNSNICLATQGGRSPCSGDSGGPLVSKVDGTLIGIASFAAFEGCESGYPVAYVRVTNYLDWIYQHTSIFY